MKKRIKNRAELNEDLVDLVDSIDDEYLAEALLLHERITDAPKRALTPRLIFKRAAIVAACLLIVAAILPLAYILTFTLGGGAKGEAPDEMYPSLDGEAPDFIPDDFFVSNSANSFSDVADSLVYVLRIGHSASLVYGSQTYVTFTFSAYDNGVFIFETDVPMEVTPEILVFAATDGRVEHSHNSPEGYRPSTVEDGFTVSIAVRDGVTTLTVDATAFIAKTGAAPDSLRAIVTMHGCRIGILPRY